MQCLRAKGLSKSIMIAARSKSAKLEIAVCAYCIWEQEGRQSGQALDHWLQAELQLAASIWHESLAWTAK